MTQANTICRHNGLGQALVPGVPVPCRKCGALVMPSPSVGNVPSSLPVNGTYPGQTAAQGAAALNS